MTTHAAKAATCTEDGNSEYYQCNRCQKVYTDSLGENETTEEKLKITKLGHDYGTLIVQKDPTCEDVGTKAHYVCSRDKCKKIFDTNKVVVEAKDLVIQALGHEYSEQKAVSATCEEPGTKAHYTCTNKGCDKVFVDEGGKKKEVTKDSLTIKAEHKYKEQSKVEPTCEGTGKQAHYTCEKCSKVFDINTKEAVDESTLTISAAGHQYSDLIPEVGKTCEADGKKAHYTCEREKCDKVFVDEGGTKKEVTREFLTIPAGHEYKLHQKVEATCEKDGTKAHYTCSKCDKVFVEEDGTKKEVEKEFLTITTQGHAYSDLHAEVPATCEAAGKKAHYTCNNCDKVFVDIEGTKTEVTEASLTIKAGHEYSDLHAEEPVTCEKDGKKAHYTCSKCDKVFNLNREEVTEESLIIKTNGHEYSNLHAEEPASCEGTGKKAHYTCNNCDKVFVDEGETKKEVTKESLEIPAGHEYSDIHAEEPASCEGTGKKAHYTCANCKKVFDAENQTEVSEDSLTIPAEGHKYATEGWESSDAAHWHPVTCGHTVDEEKAIEEKEKSGWEKHVDEDKDNACDKCKHQMHEHVFTNKRVTAGYLKTPATCTEPAVYYYSCTNCTLKSETETFTNGEAKGHAYSELHQKVEATCEETGTEAHYTCTNEGCTAVFDADQVKVNKDKLTIKTKGHTYELQGKKDASCEADGMKAHYTCKNCAKVFDADNKLAVDKESLKIPAGHEYSALHDKVEASCETDGMKAHYTCENCDKVFDADNKTAVDKETLKIPAGHKYSALHDKVEASCETDGMKAHYTCANCDKVFDAESREKVSKESLKIEALGHDTELHEANAASCTEAGNKAYYSCKNCEKLFTDKEATKETTLAEVTIEAKGHDTELHEAKEASCKETGNEAYYSCKNCEKLFEDKEATKETTLAEVTIEAKGHDTELHEAKEASCKEVGNKAYYSCVNCDKYFADEAGKEEISLEDIMIEATGHDMEYYEAEEASCEEDGHKAYYECNNCNKYFTDKEGKKETTLKAVKIKATGHTMKKRAAKKATTSKDGNIAYYYCSGCKGYFKDNAGKTETTKEKVTVYAARVKLSGNTFAYNGKSQKTKVIVTDRKGKTISSKNYKLSYASGRKNVGTHEVKVSFRGNYSGSKKLKFWINIKPTSIKKITSAKKAFTVKWTPQSKSMVTGYQVQYSRYNNFKKATTKSITSYKTASYKVSKLSGGKKYYVRIRTYKTISGKKKYSSWSSVKTVKTKR